MSPDTVVRTLEFLDLVASGGASHDQVAEALQVLAALKEQVRAVAGRMEAAAVRWIEANGDVVVGDVRYYVGPDKSTKCRSVPAALLAVLEATGGDVEAVARTLASDAFKPAACEQVLGAAWEVHFSVDLRADLKTGKPTRRLQRCDEAFARRAT